MKGHLFIEKMENIKKQRKSNMTNKKSLLGKIHLEELKVAPKTVNFVHETSKVVEMEENP